MPPAYTRERAHPGPADLVNRSPPLANAASPPGHARGMRRGARALTRVPMCTKGGAPGPTLSRPKAAAVDRVRHRQVDFPLRRRPGQAKLRPGGGESWEQMESGPIDP